MALRDWLNAGATPDFRPAATATPSTVATHQGEGGRTVATVATVAVAAQPNPEFAQQYARAREGDDFDPYTSADLVEFDGLIREDCARHRMDPEPYLAMRRRLAPARVMAELREYRVLSKQGDRD